MRAAGDDDSFLRSEKGGATSTTPNGDERARARDHESQPEAIDLEASEAADDEDGEEVGIAGVATDDPYRYAKDFYRRFTDRKPVGKLPQMLREALRLVWSAHPRAFVVAAALMLANGIGVGAQLLIGRDALAGLLRADTLGSGLGEVLPKLVVLGAVTALMKVLAYVRSYYTQQATELTARTAVSRLLDVAGAVPLSSFDDPDFYDRLKRAEFSANMRPSQIVFGLTSTLSGAVGLLGIAGALLAVEPVLVPLVLGTYTPVWYTQRRTAKEIYETEARLTAPQRERAYMQEVLTGRDEAKEVRAFGLAGVLRSRFERFYDRIVAERLSVRRRRMKVGLAAELGTIVLTGGILAALIWMIVSDRLDVAAAAAAVAAVQMMNSRLESLTFSLSGLYETSLFLEDYVSFVDMQPSIEAARPTGPAPRAFRRIEVEGVSFVYPGSRRHALRDVTMHVDAGEIVALVGENGSGKTTLAKLLAGLYPPAEGHIRWDGADIATVDPDALRASIALIFQDFVRYKLPARENIGLGRSDRMDDLAAVRAAAGQVGADRFLRRLPQGYETILSKEFEGGRDLSIGQWQRVALARAFFRDAPFIVLDEPTAALDPKAERALFDSIRTLTAGRTVLLISHRFSSVRSADRIYVLHEGRVVEGGTHEELMALAGLYAELFTLQASAYLDTTGVSAVSPDS